MNRLQLIKLSVIAICLLSSVIFYQSVKAQGPVQLPTHPPAKSDGKSLVVQLCDGETNLEVKGVKPGERLSSDQAQVVSNQLMAQWLAKQPKEVAEAWMKENLTAKESSKVSQPTNAVSASTQDQPIDFSVRDYQMWKKELDQEVTYGDQIFHDDKLLGSTNGVSCAMCHPHAANTHPETYPKFQIQLRKVALLRDMINWCIENPSRGAKLHPDDPKMRALEAYIMAQRKGTVMEPGKH
ncbi:MAG: cytochrome C [Acidobacteria bacterium]|nr:cytochrome C [Acidobacteriota bacterium]